MPRKKTASMARCVKHGADCAIGGGSNYRSSYCERVGPLTRWQAAPPDVDEDGEWRSLAAEAAAKAERNGEDGPAAAAAMLEGQQAWKAMRPEKRCESMDREDADLAAIIAQTRSAMLVAR